jgi:pimeloyl-ACP methyl ester carboxylesterase
MPAFASNGLSLYYGKKGGGDPVVLSHEVPTDYRAWASQVEALSRRFTTVAYSRRYAAPNKREEDVSDSTVWLRRIGELAAASTSKASAVKIPRSEHFPHMDNESTFNESVLAFLSK